MSAGVSRTRVVTRTSASLSATGAPDGRLTVTEAAAQAGLHPDTARRLVALGVIDVDSDGRLPADAATTLARAVRLRRDLGLNYAGALLAGVLLDRIAELERRLARYERPPRR
jgi:hypothetical protein